jgi:hypothetical protein
MGVQKYPKHKKKTPIKCHSHSWVGRANVLYSSARTNIVPLAHKCYNLCQVPKQEKENSTFLNTTYSQAFWKK